MITPGLSFPGSKRVPSYLEPLSLFASFSSCLPSKEQENLTPVLVERPGQEESGSLLEKLRAFFVAVAFEWSHYHLTSVSGLHVTE